MKELVDHVLLLQKLAIIYAMVLSMYVHVPENCYFHEVYIRVRMWVGQQFSTWHADTINTHEINVLTSNLIVLV